ncbi:ribonuclease P protein component [Cladophialophora carrionii CBS 160.54]|uniref:Ribonuclease P protein component n=1 Tax=Cladophialophora carrionii CBS 160.54 TaxID=1279043 RepID=V9DAD2_9EURO|nr:ribonuclease P protein component [Cladophialophora carrionii CBS 160.54]ETI22907.1 ribonuclease P protein component [Cladophialophora carrionii CBS 160.54]
MAPVALSRSFRNLPVPAALGFGLKARYTPSENVPTLFDHKFIVDRYSPKRAAVVDYYSRLPPDRLSWRVITNISSKQVNKAVLRNRLKRRWAGAFAEALKNHGYYHNGRKRTGPKDGKKYIPGLRGTLEILIFADRGITCPHHELVGASNALVKSLVRKVQQLEPKVKSGQDKEHWDGGESTQAPREVSSSLWSLWRKLL